MVAFQRIRFDARKTWEKLEKMLGEISPQLSGILQMTMGLLGKDRDPNFDFRRNLIDNLGDDFIVAQWPPKSSEMDDMINPPEIILVGSPNPRAFGKGIYCRKWTLTGEWSSEGAFFSRADCSLN